MEGRDDPLGGVTAVARKAPDDRPKLVSVRADLCDGWHGRECYTTHNLSFLARVCCLPKQARRAELEVSAQASSTHKASARMNRASTVDVARHEASARIAQSPVVEILCRLTHFRFLLLRPGFYTACIARGRQ